MPYAKKISCIYIITCLSNKKVYIGKTVNYLHRIAQHKRRLLEGKHHSFHLQYSYNKYGKENFTFEILEEYSKELLNSMENYWINMTDSCNRNFGFNISNPNGFGGFKMNISTKNKLRESRKNYKCSEQTKEKLRLANIDKKLTADQLNSLIEGGRKYRKTEKFIKDNKSKKNKVGIKTILYNLKTCKWEKYLSLADAGNSINVQGGHISNILNISTKSLKGYMAFTEDTFDPIKIYTKEKRNIV